MLYCQLLYFWIHSVSARLVPTRVPKRQIETKEELKRDEECDLSLSLLGGPTDTSKELRKFFSSMV